MLKLGTLKWRGRCPRHPLYSPADGEGAIRAGCPRCQGLLEIHRQHQALIALIRAYGPLRDRPARRAPESRQQTFPF